MYCTSCCSNLAVPVTHFEKDKQSRYTECKRCHTKSKETKTSFMEIMKRLSEER
jgi:hypothetical protein